MKIDAHPQERTVELYWNGAHIRMSPEAAMAAAQDLARAAQTLFDIEGNRAQAKMYERTVLPDLRTYMDEGNDKLADAARCDRKAMWKNRRYPVKEKAEEMVTAVKEMRQDVMKKPYSPPTISRDWSGMKLRSGDKDIGKIIADMEKKVSEDFLRGSGHAGIGFFEGLATKRDLKADEVSLDVETDGAKEIKDWYAKNFNRPDDSEDSVSKDLWVTAAKVDDCPVPEDF